MESKYFSCAFNKANGVLCVEKLCEKCKGDRWLGYDKMGISRCKCCDGINCDDCKDYISNVEAQKQQNKYICQSCEKDCKQKFRTDCKDFKAKRVETNPWQKQLFNAFVGRRSAR